MDIWEEFKAKGVLKEEEYWETGAWASEMSPDTLPPEEIRALIEKHFNAFLRRPRYLLREVFYTLKSLYRINIVVHNISRLDIVMNNVSTISKQRTRKKSYCT